MYLEVVYRVETIDGRHAAELKAQQQRAVVCARVAHVLTHQHEVRPVTTIVLTNNQQRHIWRELPIKLQLICHVGITSLAYFKG